MKKITVVITLFLLTLSTVLAAKTDPVRDLYTLRDMQIKYIKMLESCNTLDDLKAGKNSLISFQVKMKKLRLHAYRGILNRSRITSYNVCYTKLLRICSPRMSISMRID